MVIPDKLRTVGKFRRTHALKGELNVELEVDDDYLREYPWVIVETDGIPTPFLVESVRPKGASTSLLKIAGVETSEDAAELVNHTIYTAADDLNNYLGEDEEGMFASDFEGYTLLDTDNNRIGVIEGVNLNSEDNPLFEVASEKGTVLVPVADELIISYDPEARTITMNLPEGILDL